MRDLLLDVAAGVLTTAVLTGIAIGRQWVGHLASRCRPPLEADIREYDTVVVFGVRPRRPESWKHRLWWILLWRFDPTWKGRRPSSWNE